LLVVADAGDGLRAVAEAERTSPDVAFLRVELPNCDGVRVTALLNDRLPDCRVILVGDDGDESVLVQAIEAGAAGFVTRGSPVADLIDAARAVHRGGAAIPPQLLRPLLQRLVARKRDHHEALRKVSRLTRREREVLALLADGGDNHAIARILVISPQTARTHIQNALSKLGFHSRLEAAAFIRQNGVLAELEEATA
jgi:DNA-binding NarL/FixJ family response regulator